MTVNTVIQTDCVEGMRSMSGNRIPLTITSPPYDWLRLYGGHRFDFESIAEQLYRITMPGGVVTWVVQDQIINGSETGTSAYHRLFFRQVGFSLYNTLVMHRPGIRCPSQGRYGAGLEFAFILSKGKPRTVNLIRDKPNTTAGRTIRGSRRLFDGRLQNYTVEGKKVRRFGARGNVWSYSGRIATDRIASRHPALMYESMARDLILSWSKPGDLVFDPMCGGGTTLKMAMLNDRQYLGMEIVEEYCEISRERLSIARAQHIRQLDEWLNASVS